jgi:hypothetical protein
MSDPNNTKLSKTQFDPASLAKLFISARGVNDHDQLVRAWEDLLEDVRNRNDHYNHCKKLIELNELEDPIGKIKLKMKGAINSFKKMQRLHPNINVKEELKIIVFFFFFF